MIKKILQSNDLNNKLHWTTVISEKLLLAIIGGLTMVAAVLDVMAMIATMKIELADLFLLFIYAEIIGMVGAFYSTSRIPVTLPIIIAMTALITDAINQFASPYPVTSIGPRTVTTIPPPMRMRIHIANKNP